MGPTLGRDAFGADPERHGAQIGAQLFAHGSGIGAFVHSIALLQLATDVYGVISFGRIENSPAPWGALHYRVPGMVSGPVGAAAGVGSAVARTMWQSGATSASVTPTYGYQ